MYHLLLISALAADPIPRGDYVWGWLPTGLGGHREGRIFVTSDGDGIFVGESTPTVKPRTEKESER